MIKITKPGQKEFHGFCKWCGCEFTYEISDLKLSATSNKVSCPTCGKDYHHPSMVQDPTIPGGIGYQWPSDSTDPCAGCTWRENLLRDGVYIGDTPCTWCNKNRFNTTTGTSIQGISTLKQYINPDIKDLDAKYTSSTSTSSELNGTKYVTACNCTDDVVNGEVMKTIMECCDTNTSGIAQIAANAAVYSPKNANGFNNLKTSYPPSPPTSGSNAVMNRNSCSGEPACNGKKNCKGKR